MSNVLPSMNMHENARRHVKCPTLYERNRQDTGSPSRTDHHLKNIPVHQCPSGKKEKEMYEIEEDPTEDGRGDNGPHARTNIEPVT